MGVNYSGLVEKLRVFGESSPRVGKYEPAELTADDLTYLGSLGLPPDIEAFYRDHSPARMMVASEARFLTLRQIRVEHEEAEPGITLRGLGCNVLMSTPGGNVYFCHRKGDGYRILFGDHEQIGDDEDEEEEEEPLTPESIADVCPPEPSLDTFSELLEAFVADTLPNSPYAPEAKAKFVAWKKGRAPVGAASAKKAKPGR